jgi:hypothetical protein
VDESAGQNRRNVGRQSQLLSRAAAWTAGGCRRSRQGVAMSRRLGRGSARVRWYVKRGYRRSLMVPRSDFWDAAFACAVPCCWQT